MVKPYCVSSKCMRDANLSQNNTSGVERQLSEIKDGVCIHCQQIVTWKKKRKCSKYFSTTKSAKRKMFHERWSV